MEPSLAGNVVDCDGCTKAINDRFQACPFCGQERRVKAHVGITSLDIAAAARTEPKAPPGARQVAAVAAMMVGQAPPEPVTGPISALRSALVPSPSTTGWMRIAEIVLTLITFPFFLASTITLIFTVKRWGRVDPTTWVMGALFGSFFLYLFFVGVGLSGTHVAWTIGGCLTAWILRAALRFVSAVKAGANS